MKTKTKSEEVNEAFDLGETLKREFSTIVKEKHGGQKKYCGISALLLWMSLPVDERRRRVAAVYRAKRKEWNGDAREMEKMVSEAIAKSKRRGLDDDLEMRGVEPPEADGPSGHRRTK